MTRFPGSLCGMAAALLTACSGEGPPDSSETGLDDTGSAQEEQVRFAPYADDGESVALVAPERYLGTWFEIATTPSFQQQSCSDTTAEYSLREDGKVRVLNRCTVDGGSQNAIEGTATFLDDTYARLEVDFGFGFQAPYTIVELDGSDGGAPYDFAAVSSAGIALWVLSREPVMDESLYTTLLDRLSDAGLPSEDLVRTSHSPQ